MWAIGEKLQFGKIYNLFIRIYLMSKQEYDTNLKFGQGILIQGFKADNVDRGLLTAQGFADIKVKYQTFDDILFFKNYRNSIFQILPAGNFELNDQLHKSLIQNEGQQDTPNIRILRARAQSEKYQFELNIQNNMKKKICFGQSVIFKHIDSQSYISGTIRPSTGSNGAFTVQVSQKLSDSLVFRLMPYRSFQFLDMPIPFDSPILIKNEYNNGFLTFQKMGIIGDGAAKGPYIQKKPIQSNQSYNIPVKTQSLNSDVYEVVTHFVDLSCDKQVPMPWRFKLHVNQVINDTLIQHDVVYLQHTQNGGILSTYGKNIILKELKERTSDQLSFYDCLWEIQRHTDAGDKAYILRHLMSGMILGQEQEVLGGTNNEAIIRRPVLKDISSGRPEDGQIGYIQVCLAKKEGGEINSESFVNLAWGNQTLETCDDEPSIRSTVGKEGSSTGKVDLVRMNQLYKKQIQYNIRPLVFKQSITQEHCFIINEIEDDLKQQLLFALSFHSVIIRLREDLKFGAIEAAKKITYLKMMQVNTKVREIKKFIKDCKDEEVQLEHIFPQTKRQMICKDLGISELLFQLLYFMKMNVKEDIFSDKHNEKEKFLELYNTLYQVNRELIRKNYLFKMHVSKWFEFILDDVITSDIDCQFNLLKQLLQDNDFFINNFVTQEIIEHLTDRFINPSGESKQFIEKKYIQIFRLLCISGQKVNTFNQKLILEYFLKPLRDQNSFFQVQLTEKDGHIRIIASLDKTKPLPLSFSQFHDQACNNHPSAWAYFVQYLNLIADLAQGRNKITEQELSKVYTLPLLSELFQNQQLYEAEVPVIRLIHYLYAESEKYYPIQRRRKLLDYHALVSGEEVSINCTSAENKPWSAPLDRVLIRLLNRLKQFGPIETKAETEQQTAKIYQNNLVLHTLLKFLWETVNLGFWSSKESVRQILTDVLHICSIKEGIEEKDKFVGVQIQTKENLLMIECKMECLRIIDLIAQIDNDVLVQNIAAKFKQLEFPPKKFNLKGMLGNSPILQIRCDNELVASYLGLLPEEEAIQPIIETGVIDQMIEISNYQNPQLTNIAISIIERVLQTRKKAFEHFSQLIIISQEQRLQLVKFMETHRNKFFTLEDPGIVNVTEDNQNCNYFLIYDKQNYGLMQVLYLLTELMKNQNSVLEINRIKSIHESGVFEALGTDRLINFTGQRSSTNRMKQEIVYSSNLHIKVLNFIFSCKQMPESELGVKLLHMCYYFIVALIENFNQIKILMQSHIPKMFQHISKNVGCIDFLKEMYDNNKTMLYNEMKVFELIKQICQNIQKESNDSYYKSKLLDFFRFLIYCNGRCLKSHQIQILKIMQDDSYNNIMVPLEKDQLKTLVQEYELANIDSQQVQMSPKLTYLCTFFQIAASLIDFYNSVNIGKLIKRYPFDKLVSFLEVSGTCWPLKRNLRAFINRLYYFQSGLEALLKPILSREIPNIILDFNLYIIQKHKKNVTLVQNKKFKNPVRFSYLQSYHYLLIEESLFTIINLISKEEIVKDMLKYLNNAEKKDYESSYNWFKITERLAWLQKYFTSNKNVYTNSLIKFILSKVKPMLFLLQEPFIFQAKIPQASANDSVFRTKREILINQFLEGNIGTFFQQISPQIFQKEPLTFHAQFVEKIQRTILKVRDDNRLKQALRVIFKREMKDFLNEDEKINYNLQQLISSVKLSTQVQRYTQAQYLRKVGTYYERSDKYAYIKRIIDLNSKDPTALSSQRKLFFLLFITGLVEASNTTAPPPPPQQTQEPQPKTQIDQWEAQYWSESKAAVEQTQTQLKQCELGRFIVDLLKEDIVNDIELANSILLCAIAYMLGGNSNTQKNMLEQLQKDQENKVFANIQTLIFKLGKLIRKNIDEINTQKKEQHPDAKEFSVDMVDNYDFFDVSQKYVLRKNVSEPNSTDQYLYGILCINTYRRAFKFLQILCQSNNIEGKHIIRAQPGKARQFNFIDITTKQLRNLFQIYCYEIRKVPSFLLEFILEVTQIPIYQNQTALMNSTFFQDLCQLKNAFTFSTDTPEDQEAKAKKLDERNFKNLDDVNQIFYKSFKIILSNFQGNDKKMFVTLDNKLESKFLINFLREKLKSMGIQNSTQLANYINDYANKENDDGDKNTDFDQDILVVLDITTIYLKIIGVLGTNSRIVKFYEKFKKDEADKQRQNLSNQCKQKYPQYSEAEIETQVEKEMRKYKCLYTSLEKLLLSIEVTDQKGQDQTVYFPKYPVFDSLAGNLRDYIMIQVNRSSHRDKIVTMLSYTEGVKDKIEYSYQLNKKQGITEDSMIISFNMASKLSVVICAYILFLYNVNIQYQQAEYYSSFTYSSIRFILSLVQLIFTILYFFYWFQLKLWQNPETISRGQSKQAQAEQAAPVNQQAQQIEADQQPPPPPSFKDNIINRSKQVLEKVSGVLEAVKNQLTSQQQKWYKSSQFLRNFIFLFASVVGTFYFPPMFFLHLMIIMTLNEKLGAILQSAVFNLKSLVFISIMGVVFTVVFCTVTFSNYMKDVYSPKDDPASMCDGMLNCVSQLYVSGAIGQTMQQFEIIRFIYDIIYITFFDTMFSNIVSGLMLDAFSSLREESESRADDKENYCYICNISREALEKQAIDFTHHTRNQHFLWNYIFYIYILEHKDQTDYTGLEYYIRQQYNKPDQEMEVHWIPNKGESEFDVQTEAQFLSTQITDKIEQFNQKHSLLEDSVSQFKKLAKQYLE